MITYNYTIIKLTLVEKYNMSTTYWGMEDTKMMNLFSVDSPNNTEEKEKTVLNI